MNDKLNSKKLTFTFNVNNNKNKKKLGDQITLIMYRLVEKYNIKHKSIEIGVRTHEEDFLKDRFTLYIWFYL